MIIIPIVINDNNKSFFVRMQKEYRNGTWYFNCDHGPDECFANKATLCAFQQIHDQDGRVEFVHCLEAKSNPGYVKSSMEVSI